MNEEMINHLWRDFLLHSYWSISVMTAQKQANHSGNKWAFRNTDTTANNGLEIRTRKLVGYRAAIQWRVNSTKKKKYCL